ncbi:MULTISPECIES: nucleoside recognition domain-containing protein [Sphingobacterium]|jgi:spore maturation protein SpmA|uniref:Spore maturation protein A n=1 Tax=Sphingobacterium multivorum TaxID=28454 RepID=A0A2X2JMY7_SPHMU|nr:MULTISPECIES: spore maturation protein [Sphingobacterium]QRQ63319.1 spore maturation protein [Sphingobacterium multivorum]SPZ95214.1 Spore maturation protein A [Sphingobacterium multivorum]
MALNYVWVAFFLITFAVALVKLIFFGDTEIFQQIVNSIFDSAKTGAEISLGLIGMMSFALGIMKIGEKGGMINIFAKIVGPFFHKLFPEIPRNHPALGSILMNFSANALGLDNAATPLGLKAMKELQELNPNKETATNAQIMFIVLNASSLTLLPISIMAYRKEAGAPDPSDVFLPILIATFFSTLVALILVSIYQKINLFNRVILGYLGAMGLFIGGLLYYFSGLQQTEIEIFSKVFGNVILFSLFTSFIGLALFRKVNVYDSFIEGAKEGFEVSVKIIPYLVAMLVGIAVFRASGTMDYMVAGISEAIALCGLDTSFVDALPVAFMKPLSGSGARGLMVDLMNAKGPMDFAARVACVIQGSTETTFYVLAVYFGAVGIKRTRHALPCALLAELAGVIAAIIISYIFFK